MKNKKILLVDDDKELCAGLKEIFSDEGYIIHTVFDGQEAMHILNQEDYDLLLLDIKLPGLTGFDILRKLKAALKKIKIIVLTARPLQKEISENLTESNNEEEDLLTYADAVINKPFDIGMLLKTVRNVSSQA
jgi:DNA-binding response OmpR family regulator